MSIRIWKEIADQKKQVEDQRARILNAFKQRSVEDQVGTLKAEKLFQPITKLLVTKDKKQEKEKFPDYAVSGEDINFMDELPFAGEAEPDEDPYADLKPFEDDQENLRPSEGQSVSEKVEDYSGFLNWLHKHGYKSDEDIVPLPEKSSREPEEITPLSGPFGPGSSAPVPEEDPYADLEPVSEELGEEVLPGAKLPPLQSAPSYSEATRDDKPPKYKEPRDDDSSNLSTLTRFIKNNEGKPGAKITTKKSKFVGYSIDKAREKIYEIYTERAKKVLEKGDNKSAIGQKELGPYDGKSNEEMLAMIDEFEQGKKAQSGTGFNTLVNRLSLGISSIVAGNTSIKLKKEIRAIAKLLHQKGVISNEQKNKVLSLK